MGATEIMEYLATPNAEKRNPERKGGGRGRQMKEEGKEKERKKETPRSCSVFTACVV